MSFFDYFRKRPKSASLAKDRLSIIVARERAGTRTGGADYLPQLQQELLAVIARYETIDIANVTVNLDRHGGSERPARVARVCPQRFNSISRLLSRCASRDDCA
jgi:cell division topological specificity factor